MSIQEYRGYQIKPHKTYPSSYIVVTAGQGGKIPDILSSFYTTRQYAIDAIDLYLLTRKKGKTNDKEIDES